MFPFGIAVTLYFDGSCVQFGFAMPLRSSSSRRLHADITFRCMESVTLMFLVTLMESVTLT